MHFASSNACPVGRGNFSPGRLIPSHVESCLRHDTQILGGGVLVANSSCATPRVTDQAVFKPWSRQPPLSPSWPASPNDKLITRTASMCNGHPLRRYGENRPIGASYPSMTHHISFILLKRALVGRLPFVAWHTRPRRVCRYREGGGSSSESILGESGKWRGHRAACMGDVRMSLCGDTR